MTRFAKWSSVLPPLALAVTTAHAQQPVDDAQVARHSRFDGVVVILSQRAQL